MNILEKVCHQINGEMVKGEKVYISFIDKTGHKIKKYTGLFCLTDEDKQTIKAIMGNYSKDEFISQITSKKEI
jgi:hypothetical protein